MLATIKEFFKEESNKHLKVHSTSGDTYIVLNNLNRETIGEEGDLSNALNIIYRSLDNANKGYDSKKIIAERNWEEYGYTIVKKEALHNLYFEIL